jgi:hypothetical protein
VVPVTRVRPRWQSATSITAVGRYSFSIVGIFPRMARIVMPGTPTA